MPNAQATVAPGVASRGRPGDVGNDIRVSLVDTDVHPAPRSPEDLLEHLPRRWHGTPTSVFTDTGTPIYIPPNDGKRRDSYPVDGAPPCSDPDLTHQQLLVEAGVDYAILLPLTARATTNPAHEAAVCAATNEWLANTWLSKYRSSDRYRGALRVCSTDPQLASGEIEERGGDRRFAEVMLLPHTLSPMGQRQYWPIYESAQRHGLPVAIHVNRAPGLRLLTPVGFSAYFLEHHALYPMLYATQLSSMIYEGVFERFPKLSLVLVEGGFSWIAPFMWRMDKHWEALRSEIPNVKRRPSEYIMDHVRFTSQPIEEPENHRSLMQIFDWAGADKLLMFSTDYPHWDYDNPRWVSDRLPRNYRESILWKNAVEFYQLPPVRKDNAEGQGT